MGQSIQESRPYHVKFFKACLPQILLGPFLNTLSQMNFSDLTISCTFTFEQSFTEAVGRFDYV